MASERAEMMTLVMDALADISFDKMMSDEHRTTFESFSPQQQDVIRKTFGLGYRYGFVDGLEIGKDKSRAQQGGITGGSVLA